MEWAIWSQEGRSQELTLGSTAPPTTLRLAHKVVVHAGTGAQYRGTLESRIMILASITYFHGACTSQQPTVTKAEICTCVYMCVHLIVVLAYLSGQQTPPPPPPITALSEYIILRNRGKLWASWTMVEVPATQQRRSGTDPFHQ